MKSRGGGRGWGGSRGELVSRKHKPEQIKSMPSPVFHLSTKIFHTLAKKKEAEGEKREGGKFTAIITLHQHTQISHFFSSFFLPFRLKGALLLSFKDMQISLSPPHLHFNKLALLNALGRIKVEVRFECIQRWGWEGVGVGAGVADWRLGRERMGSPLLVAPCTHYCTLLHLAPIRFSVPLSAANARACSLHAKLSTRSSLRAAKQLILPP